MKQGRNSQPCGYVRRAQEWLGAKPSIVTNQQVFEFKTRAGKKSEVQRSQLDVPAQCQTDGLRDSPTKVLCRRPYKKQRQKQQAHQTHTAPGKQGLPFNTLKVPFQRVSRLTSRLSPIPK